ncbi:hypothetical protein [Massilia sp. TWR1-2-2]|uniref:hypothetical protein n=1 Tax=Massilia sp. TWR1-2-2 TaxID=2804584 RepID=UPI003CE67ACB
MKKNSQVVLVLDPKLSETDFFLTDGMPLWIVESAQNRTVVEKIRSAGNAPDSITFFPLRGNESPRTACERIVQSLDEHHDECSQTPAYDELTVVGVGIDEVSLAPFVELGFTQFQVSTLGFIAKKIPIHEA